MTQYGAALAAAALALAGCGDPSVDRPDGSSLLRDGGAATPPPAPRLDAVATPVPWPVATLRGQASEADRVIVEGAGNPIASTVLPDGTFCVDVPMPSPDAYSLRLVSQRAGRFSESAATAEVVFDPAAAPIPGLTRCDGSDPAGCIGSEEICGNGVDDDCNGLRDDRDPACATCADDALEPNDDASAPRIEPGRYDGLRICPMDSDFYGIYLRTGDTVTVRLFFVHTDGDVDVQLLAPDGTTVLERSASVTDDEMIVYIASETGEHEIRVYGVGEASNDYALDLGVVPAG